MSTKPQPTCVWHEGELEVQQLAGVRREADDLAGMYRRAVEPGMVGFLAQQRFAVATTVDQQARTWTSLIAGEPGMLAIPDPTVVKVNAARIESALPLDNLAKNSKLGMLVIDFARRIRVRINGEAEAQPDGSVLLSIRQLYGNCAQYIQRRTVIATATPQPEKQAAITGDELTQDQADLIRKSDTFFLGSVHAESGADASHRGGLPGFVQVHDSKNISFPDYSGNNMFNTLGNVAINPSVGLLFFDFESGRALALTGKATVDWADARARELPAAKRVIDVEVEEVRDTPAATSLRYRFEAFSPFLTQEK